MYAGKMVFAQLVDHLPLHSFRRSVARYGGEFKVHSFSCLDQFLCLAFAQLTYRESLRDIETCLRAQSAKLYHLGLRGKVSRSTLADANESRDWRIYEQFAQELIRQARLLYAREDLGLALDATVYAFDATVIDLCLTLFPWARFRKHKAGVKLHTLLDLRGNIPSVIHVSEAALHDINALDWLIPEAGAFYVMDRGYLDFERLFTLAQAGAFFVIRARSNLRCQRVLSRAVEKPSGLRCDQIITLSGISSQRGYPQQLRRVKFYDAEHDRTFVFLTNHFELPALTVARLYQQRWQVELFFKWIKQHLRIKAFFGTSENAVKTQVWTAVSVYVLIAIIRKRLNINRSLYEMLQILSVTTFKKIPPGQLLAGDEPTAQKTSPAMQLKLLE